MQVHSDLAPVVVPDRTHVKTGDLVNFAVIARNLGSRVASHLEFEAAESAGFQVLGQGLGSFG